MAQSPLPLATAPVSPSLPAAPTDSRKVGEKKETTLRMLPVSDGDIVEKVWFGLVDLTGDCLSGFFNFAREGF